MVVPHAIAAAIRRAARSQIKRLLLMLFMTFFELSR
jgi:hypothetical protein